MERRAREICRTNRQLEYMPRDSAAEQKLSALYAAAVTNIGIVCS